MRSFLVNREIEKHFRGQPDLSQGKWKPAICPEPVQCLVCRHIISMGEPICVSPGKWVRHPTCIWPSQARGVDPADTKD